MPFAASAGNYMLDQWGSNKGLYASAHSAYSATGANELTGGSPAYARIAVTWAASAGGTKALNGTLPTFNVPAGSSVGWLGFWDSLTGGNFQGMFPNGGASPFAFAAPSSTSVLTAPGSAYAANQQVVVFPTGGATLPTGLTAGTVYYVKSPSSDMFSLAATSGGSAITLSADGSGIVQAITVEAFASQGTFPVSSGSVSLV